MVMIDSEVVVFISFFFCSKSYDLLSSGSGLSTHLPVGINWSLKIYQTVVETATLSHQFNTHLKQIITRMLGNRSNIHLDLLPHHLGVMKPERVTPPNSILGTLNAHPGKGKARVIYRRKRYFMQNSSSVSNRSQLGLAKSCPRRTGNTYAGPTISLRSTTPSIRRKRDTLANALRKVFISKAGIINYSKAKEFLLFGSFILKVMERLDFDIRSEGSSLRG